VETFVDDGYYDMRKAIEALKETDFNGVLIPDHVPLMGDDARIGVAYTIGWIKAMMRGEEE
jgi:mannonate dehydratase